MPEVRLVGPQGEQVGIVRLEQALQLAREADLDLVEVAPDARPPVCKIMDYGKFKYENAQKARESRRNQAHTVIKEMKLRPKIDEHDYDFKVRAIKSFLEDGHRVKVSVFFRGREMSFLDKGEKVLARVVKDCNGLGKSEGNPRMEGRYMRIMMTPLPQVPPKPAARGENARNDTARNAVVQVGSATDTPSGEPRKQENSD